KTRRGAGMVPGAITMGPGLVMRQAGKDLKILLKWFEWLENVRQFKIGACGLRHPINHVRPIRNINESHAARENFASARFDRRQRLDRRYHCLEGGQDDGGADTLEE